MMADRTGNDFLQPDWVPRRVVAAGGNIFGDGLEVTAHQHRKAQLIYMARGVLTCEASQGLSDRRPRKCPMDSRR